MGLVGRGATMNQGLLAILIVAATIGAAAWVAIHRDVIYPPTTRPATRPRVRAGPLRISGPTRRPETEQKPHTIVSSPVSGVATPNDDPEMIAVRALAKLIAAQLVTETAALETVFSVKAGSSKAYKSVQAKLKAAQAELESRQQPQPIA